MPVKECLTCGEEYRVRKSRVDDAKFCSRECYHNGQKQGKTSHPERYVEYVEVECTECGGKVEKPPSRANRSDRQFCDQDCYHNWSNKHQQKQTGRRKRIREKEKKSCEICEFDRFIEMAHIIPSRNGGTYHKRNILFLCPNHHRLLDHGKLSKEEFTPIEDKIRDAVCEELGWQSPDNQQKSLKDE